MTIVPSIIAKDQKELNARYKKIKGISKTIHLDIMDGAFVKNKSLWFDFKLPKGDYEAHLMTTRPEMFIGRHVSSINTFMVHIETTKKPQDVIDFVRQENKKIFFALNPETPIGKVKKYLTKIDGVLVMTVKPGKYGAKFIPKSLNKVKQLRKLNRFIPIEVDGSINNKTITLARKAGANRFSVGSYIQKSKTPKKALDELKNL